MPVNPVLMEDAAAHAGAALAALQPQCLTVQVGDEMFALGIEAICEIVEYRDLTVVPLVKPVIRGVINLRGAVVPVVDLAIRLGRAPSPVTERSCIVVVELAQASHWPRGYKLGLVVDAVSQVLALAATDQVPAPEFGTHLRQDFIRAMARMEGRFMALLDLERILSLSELAISPA